MADRRNPAGKDVAADVMQRLVDLGFAEHEVRVDPETGRETYGIRITPMGNEMAASGASPFDIARLIKGDKLDG